MRKDRAPGQIGTETMNERFVREAMKPITDHPLLRIPRRQWEPRRRTWQRAVECSVKTSNLQCLWETPLRLPDEFDRRRDVQRSEVSRFLQFLYHLWCDRLVIAQMGPAMYNAMTNGYGRDAHMFLHDIDELC